MNSDEDVDNENEEENAFYSNRNVSTVKVNAKRKSIESQNIDHENVVSIINDIMNDINKPMANDTTTTENDELRLRNITNKDETNVASPTTKNSSEREKRIAEKVNTMRQKQIEHEQQMQHKSTYFMHDLNPIFIGGGIFLGGLLLHHLYKIYFK